MRVIVAALAAMVAWGPATAQSQTSNTNCYASGNSLNCNTVTRSNPGIDWNAYNRSQQQAQQNMAQAFENLGAAIAQRREEKRLRDLQLSQNSQAQWDAYLAANAAAKAQRETTKALNEARLQAAVESCTPAMKALIDAGKFDAGQSGFETCLSDYRSSHGW